MNATLETTSSLVGTQTTENRSAPISPFASLLAAEGTETVYAYDPEADIATITVKDHAPIAESDDTIPGIIVDLDTEGRTVGIEILDFARIAGSLGFFKIVVPDPSTSIVTRNG